MTVVNAATVSDSVLSLLVWTNADRIVWRTAGVPYPQTGIPLCW